LEAQSPQRIGVSTETHKVLFMPSRLDHTTSIKIVSVPTKDGLSGLPATILVIDEKTGGVEAVMNADALTAVRTAAGWYYN
jgi:ornithine cyclodeaminase